MARRSLLGALALLALTAAATADGAAPAPVASPLTATPRLAVIKPAPDFVLRDLDGGALRLTDLRGRPVLLAFVYTRCTSACPLLSARMAILQRRLVAMPTGHRPLLVSITVDPERDSADALRRYAARFGADPATWRFLREEPAALMPVLRAWGEWTRRAPDGDLDHPARVYLIDAASRVREIYSLQFFDERQAWLDLQALLRER